MCVYPPPAVLGLISELKEIQGVLFLRFTLASKSMFRLALLLLILAPAAIYPAAESAPAPEKQKVEVVNPATIEVWITATGKRYHRATCRHAKIQSNLKAALERNLTPCLVCNP